MTEWVTVLLCSFTDRFVGIYFITDYQFCLSMYCCIAENIPQFYLDLQILLYTDLQLHRFEAMPAQFKEIIIDTYPFPAQNFCPDYCEPDLCFSSRRYVSRVTLQAGLQRIR